MNAQSSKECHLQPQPQQLADNILFHLSLPQHETQNEKHENLSKIPYCDSRYMKYTIDAQGGLKMRMWQITMLSAIMGTQRIGRLPRIWDLN